MLVQAESGWTPGTVGTEARGAAAWSVRTRLLDVWGGAVGAGCVPAGKLTPRPARRHPRYGVWLIIRCAYGVPANMIQVPWSLGVVLSPVTVLSKGQRIIQ